MDWFDSGADIRANAEVLKEVIRFVNRNKTPNARNVLVGKSMGGLISRYCLFSMEEDGEKHQTSIFISYDSPQCGANVPIGAMFAFYDITSIIRDPLIGIIMNLFKMDLNDLMVKLNTLSEYKSVRQMCPLFVNKQLEIESSSYMQLQAELSQKGYPKGDGDNPIENIAIINGGLDSSGSVSQFIPNEKLLHFSFDASSKILGELLLYLFFTPKIIPAPIIIGRYNFHFDVDIFPYLSNSQQVYSSNISFTKKFRWIFSKTWKIRNQEYNAPSSGIPLDAAAGSFYNLKNLRGFFLNTLNVSSLFGEMNASMTIAKKFMFIPTSSALSINGNYFRDFYTNPPIPLVETPFSSFYLNDTTSSHTSLLSGSGVWFDNIINTGIVGPDFVDDEAQYSISGPISGLNFVWSSSNPNVATVDKNGLVSRVRSGVTKITAVCNINGQTISKTKELLVGFPEITLSKQGISGGGYVIKTKVSNHNQERLFNSIVKSGGIRYRWNVLDGDSAIETINSSCDSLILNPQNETSRIEVFMSLECGTIISSPLNIVVRYGVLFSSNIRSIGFPLSGDLIILTVPLHSTITSEFGRTCLVLRDETWPSSAPIPSKVVLYGRAYPLIAVRETQEGVPLYVFDFFSDIPYLVICYRIQFLNSFLGAEVYKGYFPLLLYSDDDSPCQEIDILVGPSKLKKIIE